MDFDQLESFLEVARHASFSRAAEKRFRTQPAISSQIRGIEEEVGAKLFDRSGGKVSLTAAGKAFQKYVEDTLDARKAMMVAIAEMERVPRGEIIVGANEGTCLHILPYVFADFKKQYPDVSVNIKRADYNKILESVIDNTVDFGVVSLPVTDNRLTVVLIHRDDLIIIAPPQHPLGRMKAATIADVAKFPLVVPKAGHTRDAIEQLFHERRLKPNFTMNALVISIVIAVVLIAGAFLGYRHYGARIQARLHRRPSVQNSDAAPGMPAASQPPPAIPYSTAGAGLPGTGTPNATEQPVAGTPDTLLLKMEASKPADVKVTADGKVLFDGPVQANDVKQFDAHDTFEISSTDSSALTLELDGQSVPPIGMPGKPGSITLTRDNLKPATEAPH